MTPRDSLSRALRRLRDLEPTEQLAERLDAALRAAEAEERPAAPKRTRYAARRNLSRNLVLVVPALASMAVALHLVVAEPSFDVGHTAEHALELPVHGAGLLPVELLLDAHDTAFASVRMHVPHGVRITGTGTGEAPVPSCEKLGCVYEFMHPTGDDAPPVQLQVREPGRYRVHVEHASPDRRVQELLVVHAHR
jgi:hypothetical protein